MSANPQPTPGLRERVAELRGWRTEGNWVISPDGERGNVLDGWAYPPFDSDLNHAHAAVRALLVTVPSRRTFIRILADIVWSGYADDTMEVFLIFMATPEQICTALLRTLGGEEGATEPPKCGQCNGEGCPSHACPYACDINEDYESRCTCCEGCQGLCAMEV